MEYPKGEIVWVGYYNSKEELRYIITSKSSREYYFCYEVDNDKLVKLGKAKTPSELVKKYKIEEVLGK